MHSIKLFVILAPLLLKGVINEEQARERQIENRNKKLILDRRLEEETVVDGKIMDHMTLPIDSAYKRELMAKKLGCWWCRYTVKANIQETVEIPKLVEILEASEEGPSVWKSWKILKKKGRGSIED